MTTPPNDALSTITVRGARENNLRDIDIDLPKRSLIVFAGVSGSGKSSLVFDTIAAEAQRQINSTFSAFAQTFLPSYGRPDADLIANLSAVVIVDQKRLFGSPRSTVGTITDIGDWLRMLWSRGVTPPIGYANAFSFNDPAGMCPECEGLGEAKVIDIDELVDQSKSLREGPVKHPDFLPGKWPYRLYADSGLFDLDVPLEQYSPRERHLFFDASPGEVEMVNPDAVFKTYEGLLSRFRRSYLSKDADALKGKSKEAYDRIVTRGVCPSCRGTRLNETVHAATLEGLSIPDAFAMQVSDLADVMDTWALGDLDGPRREVVTQLRRLVDLGLGYLSLDRATSSLSGGESQRIKMVRHLGATLNDMLYVFDEPTTGLHPRDVHRLNDMLIALRDKGNTVLVVEHDAEVMAIADRIVEIGPGAGKHGGTVVFEGTWPELRQSETRTGTALRRDGRSRRTPRTPNGWMRIENADSHNLKNVSVDIPLGVLVAVTGVAGSGKSSLIHGHLRDVRPDAVVIDQAPIRGSRRSSPATYTGLLDPIRAHFAKRTGQPAALFSPNSDGACPDCQGTGMIFTDLGFTDPVSSTCETCQGRRFRSGAIKHTVDGVSIADVFDMSVDEAREFFTVKKVRDVLRRCSDVGLGYLSLGQNLTSLSGGERQRLKLATELVGNSPVLVLDEPTTGLHSSDVDNLVGLLSGMVDEGRSVIVIEHNMDVVAAADWVVDLGPDGGHDGGEVVFTGTVDELVLARTHTGTHLARALAE
ncbi:excinuclease ABC subunit UvrA [Rhodococcus sp. BP-149]|uniref:ATP-binding cassette domain-containing protein n=1 Tax=unclassified Rhodococcus (in: high G+C Gram-positive bacteria) TaxID=192944 RepID=UPI001C9A3462|nr:MULTISPECIES: excinuclease ABC subunit UvrA [unclassified Rhodococcus (in: high G+C Gram-positive bacteria)]MBY6687334.1 excinuclease ABC subunit UvrA [Rhodococcus sp. BP-288]MBY6694243.1 excinuclease ABC subunit UvrA [Rhodococcus sp. BP-188]MBY6697952.1 excinuclease ABC subunit UvrA [Rhodococcus sp. BP-285]MBY6704172.1 excinuclease ABC subunit UvrA [Rhodococcus sp. BP-283]MBY6712821.1 excinuclease ABC subunit UvrA [Rhodococcus sp. BP-160]